MWNLGTFQFPRKSKSKILCSDFLTFKITFKTKVLYEEGNAFGALAKSLSDLCLQRTLKFHI